MSSPRLDIIIEPSESGSGCLFAARAQGSKVNRQTARCRWRSTFEITRCSQSASIN